MQPISILIAADDARVRQCLRRAVEQDANFRVFWEADDGLKALCLAHVHNPQVVLLDEQMPRMDGIEAARFLRQRNHNLHILVMGVYEHTRAQALAAGADAFLTKDCGCDALHAAIHHLLNGNVDHSSVDSDNTTRSKKIEANTDENPEGFGVAETGKHDKDSS